MITPPEDRSPIAVAIAWAWRLIGISATMVVPGLLGYWLDQRLGAGVFFTLAGFALGMATGMVQLVRATRAR